MPKAARDNKHQLQLGGFDGLFDKQRQIQLERPLRNDFNLSRLPYFITAHDAENRFRDLKFELANDDKGNSVVWEVQHCRLGLPGTFDRDVWLGILEIINEITEGGRKPCPEYVELGTARGFLRRLGKSGNGGKDMAMVREAIERIARTTCISKMSFNCPTAGGYLGEVFTLVAGWGFVGESDGKGGVNETNFVRINNFVRKNLDSGYIALIDVKYLRSLKTEIGKQLYQLLSYFFWKARTKENQSCSLNWKHIANYLGITSWDCLSRAKKRLRPALEELVNREYIAEYHWDDERLICFAGTKFREEQLARVQNPKLETRNPLLPLAVRWATGYNPTPEDLRKKGCTVNDLKALALAENIQICRD